MTDAIELVNDIIHSIVNYTALLFNALLMYLILFNTPKPLRSYAVLLFNFAITDFLASSSALFVMQSYEVQESAAEVCAIISVYYRIIPAGWSLFYISYGYCTYVGPLSCYIGYAFMLHCYAHTLLSMPLSFFYRYYVLIKVMFTTASDDVGAVRKKVHEKFPEYNLTGVVVTGHLDINNVWTIYTILYMTIPSGPVYLTIMYLRRKVYSCLDAVQMSDATKKTHKLLIKALTLQACLPGIFLFAACLYGIEQVELYHHQMLEHAVFHLVGILPCASPIISLYFVVPYRRAILKKYRRLTCKPNVEPVRKIQSTTTGASRGTETSRTGNI